jgi:hypothetical protein
MVTLTCIVTAAANHPLPPNQAGKAATKQEQRARDGNRSVHTIPIIPIVAIALIPPVMVPIVIGVTWDSQCVSGCYAGARKHRNTQHTADQEFHNLTSSRSQFGITG